MSGVSYRRYPGDPPTMQSCATMLVLFVLCILVFWLPLYLWVR
jgi:hypothetical protein